jgi:hypothetical protein
VFGTSQNWFLEASFSFPLPAVIEGCIMQALTEFFAYPLLLFVLLLIKYVHTFKTT